MGFEKLDKGAIITRHASVGWHDLNVARVQDLGFLQAKAQGLHPGYESRNSHDE